MRPILTALVAAIEAAAVALAGLVVLAIPAVALWAATFQLASDPGEVFGGAAAVWLLAHFVPLSLEMSAETASSLGFAPEAIGIPISLAPLGATLVTVLLAVRSGWRLAARGGAGSAGVLGGAVGFAAVAAVAVPLGAPLLAAPVWVAIALPAAVYTASSAAAYLLHSVIDGSDWWLEAVRRLQRGLERSGVPALLAASLPGHTREVFRLLLASLAGLVGLGSVGLTVALVTGYVDITALAQGLQLDPLGAVLLFLLQLALIPVVVVWAIAWFTGSGFAIGEATSVSPFETMLGPLPSLPLLGAVPQGWGQAGALAPALVVLLGIGIGLLAARHTELRRASWPAAIAVTVLAAALTGLAIAGCAALATGAVGPGRLAVTGPDPWITGGLAAAELGGGLLLGVCAGRADRARLRAAIPLSQGRDRLAPEPDGNEVDDALVPAPFRVRGSLPDADVDLATEDLSGVREPETAGRGTLLRRAAGWLGASKTGNGGGRGGVRWDRPSHAGAGTDAGADADTDVIPDEAVGDAIAADAETDVVALGAGAGADDDTDVVAVDTLDPEADPDTEPADAAPDADADDVADADRHDTEALLRAYSWDGARDEGPAEETKRPGWRWPRGKG